MAPKAATKTLTAWADPKPAFGVSEPVAATSEGVVLLRQHADRTAMLDVVRRFFEAFRSRDFNEFQSRFGPNVYLQSDASYARPFARDYIVMTYTQRATTLHYETLTMESIYDEHSVRFFEFDDFDLPNRPERPAYMTRDQIMIVVSIVTPKVGSNTFFGDSVTLIVETGTDLGVRIVGIREDLH
jgi:hypothetical protein